MKEDLYKYIQIFILFLPINLIALDLESKNYIFSDFVPYQESKTSIGLNIYKDSKKSFSFVTHNWFSKNLLFSTSLEQDKNYNVINIKYKVMLGYALEFKNKNIKNLLLSAGYSRSRFDSISNNKSNILFGLLLNMKFKKIWFNPSYTKIYQDNYFNQITLSFTKSFNKYFIVLFGYKILENNNNYLKTPYLSIRYNI